MRIHCGRRGIPGRGGFQKRGALGLVRGSGRGLRVPHCWRLRGVTGHGVAGARAVLRGQLSRLHDLLQLGPFVLEPDFNLRRNETRSKIQQQEQQALITFTTSTSKKKH